SYTKSVSWQHHPNNDSGTRSMTCRRRSFFSLKYQYMAPRVQPARAAIISSVVFEKPVSQKQNSATSRICLRVSSAANFVCRTTVEISIDILFQEISLGHLVPTQQPFTQAQYVVYCT
ncbi:TPA: hypothetical protein ACV40V_004804, partial [Escherichia coli]